MTFLASFFLSSASLSLINMYNNALHVDTLAVSLTTTARHLDVAGSRCATECQE